MLADAAAAATAAAVAATATTSTSSDDDDDGSGSTDEAAAVAETDAADAAEEEVWSDVEEAPDSAGPPPLTSQSSWRGGGALAPLQQPSSSAPHHHPLVPDPAAAAALLSQLRLRLEPLVVPSRWRPEVRPDGEGTIPIAPVVPWPAAVPLDIGPLASSTSGFLPDADAEPNWTLITQLRDTRCDPEGGEPSATDAPTAATAASSTPGTPSVWAGHSDAPPGAAAAGGGDAAAPAMPSRWSRLPTGYHPRAMSTATVDSGIDMPSPAEGGSPPPAVRTLSGYAQQQQGQGQQGSARPRPLTAGPTLRSSSTGTARPNVAVSPNGGGGDRRSDPIPPPPDWVSMVEYRRRVLAPPRPPPPPPPSAPVSLLGKPVSPPPSGPPAVSPGRPASSPGGRGGGAAAPTGHGTSLAFFLRGGAMPSFPALPPSAFKHRLALEKPTAYNAVLPRAGAPPAVRRLSGGGGDNERAYIAAVDRDIRRRVRQAVEEEVGSPMPARAAWHLREQTAALLSPHAIGGEKPRWGKRGACTRGSPDTLPILPSHRRPARAWARRGAHDAGCDSERRSYGSRGRGGRRGRHRL